MAIPTTKATKYTPKTSTSTGNRAKLYIPSIQVMSGTGVTTSGRSYAPSVLSNNVKIIGHQSSDLAEVKAEPAPAVSIRYNGGLSDNDEMSGEERDVAINSPPKGKKRITSEVVFFFFV